MTFFCKKDLVILKLENETKFCPNCGFDLTEGEASAKPTPTSSHVKSGTYQNTNENVWKTIEKYVVFAGQYSWVFIVINIIVYLITALGAIIGLNFVGLWVGIWMLISILISGAILIFWVFPFSKKIAQHDYAYLINNVILFGKLRVPKMLLIGIILEIFTQGWGGLLVLIPALCICFLGPEFMRWRA